MKQKKANLLISSVAMVASIIVVFYLAVNMPTHIELLIVFSLIALADTYFLVDGILKKVDEIANLSMDKQTEIAKVEKGIYSVAKREETNRAESMEDLLAAVAELKTENTRLQEALLEQEKLCTKILMKKNQENTTKMVGSSDRVAKLLVQLTSNNKDISEEALKILKDMDKQLGGNPENVDMSNVMVMPPRAE